MIWRILESLAKIPAWLWIGIIVAFLAIIGGMQPDSGMPGGYDDPGPGPSSPWTG